MKKVLFVLLILLQCLTFAQLKKLTAPDMYSPADIYLDDNGNRYSTLVTLKFNEFAISLPKGEKSTSIDQIRFPEARNFVNTLVKKYGGVNLEKAIPNADWGDTIRVNKRTGKTVYIKDMSQIFTLKFTNLVPVDSIVSELRSLPNIEYVVGPIPAYLTTSPNDPAYLDTNYKWSFDAINASRAWDITKGSSNIRVSLNDNFDNLGDLHEDLKGKVVYKFSTTASGGHGNITAGVVGALSNNNMDIASLGWNTSIMFNSYRTDFSEVNSAVLNGADVINFSWVTPQYDPNLAAAIHNAILQGVVCVAAAGNNNFVPPRLYYPAAYNFGSDGKVIAVSGTELNNGTEIFIPGFNYCPGTDPIVDPTKAFIDCAAPGANYSGLNDKGTTGTIHIWSGTSISAPFVSALVSLILSINNSLIPSQIYNIITKSADKIGLDSYNSNGWNRYLGYGRINAYNALKYTLEHYGGTIIQSFSIPKGETWNIDPGKTINFQNGITLTVSGTLITNSTLTIPTGASLITQNGAILKFGSGASLIVHGNLNANGTTFTSLGNTSPGSWGNITLSNAGANGSHIEYCNIQYGNEIDLINSNNVTIQYCKIINSYRHGINFSGSSGSYAGYNMIKNTNADHGIVVQNSSNVNCLGNTIVKTNTNHEGVGILFVGGGIGIVAQNDICGFNWGIGALWGSSPSSANYNNRNNRNNRISKCSIGLEVYYDSYPNFGTASKDYIYGQNSVEDCTLNVSVGLPGAPNSYTSSLSANFNWWGNSTPDNLLFITNANGSLSYGPWATSDPWAGIPLPVNQISGGSSYVDSKIQSAPVLYSNMIGLVDGSVNSSVDEDSVFRGLDLFNNKNSIEAKNFYLSYLKQHPDNQAVYNYLYNCADSITTPEIINFFNSLPPIAAKEHKLLLAYLYHKQRNIELAKEVNNQVIIENPNSILGVRAKLNNFYIELYDDNNIKTAALLLNEIKSQTNLSTPIEISLADDALGNFNSATSSDTKTQVTKEEGHEGLGKPTSYSLSQNYPNPFNPSTTIRYQIPVSGNVTLKVYDIIGSEIATLVNEYKNEGSYDYSFNASRFASGVYIYQLSINSYVSSKKMILLK